MTSPGRVHIVGAGLAGLSAALTLAAEGGWVALYEASQHAGGRCRSYLDAELGCRIDNGNHLLLAGNTATLAYVERTGALDTFERQAEAEIPFIDVASGERGAVRPNRGAVPWRLLSPARRGPGTRPRDYLEAPKLRRAPARAAVTVVLDPATRPFPRRLPPPRGSPPASPSPTTVRRSSTAISAAWPRPTPRPLPASSAALPSGCSASARSCR